LENQRNQQETTKINTEESSIAFAEEILLVHEKTKITSHERPEDMEDFPK